MRERENEKILYMRREWNEWKEGKCGMAWVWVWVSKKVRVRLFLLSLIKVVVDVWGSYEQKRRTEQKVGSGSGSGFLPFSGFPKRESWSWNCGFTLFGSLSGARQWGLSWGGVKNWEKKASQLRTGKKTVGWRPTEERNTEQNRTEHLSRSLFRSTTKKKQNLEQFNSIRKF